jgi:hypothetical protein
VDAIDGLTAFHVFREEGGGHLPGDQTAIAAGWTQSRTSQPGFGSAASVGSARLN